MLTPPPRATPSTRPDSSRQTTGKDKETGKVSRWIEYRDALANPERKWICVVAFLQWIVALGYFILAYLEISASHDIKVSTEIVIVGSIIMGFVYLGLWIWAKTAPLAAPLAAMSLYLAFSVINFVLAPDLVIKAIAFKVLIIYGLWRAIKAGYYIKY